MKVISEDCLFLDAERVSFKGENGDVEYVKMKYVDGDNNFIEATVHKDIVVEVLQLDPRETIRVELEIEEKSGKRGTYLKRTVLGVS